MRKTLVVMADGWILPSNTSNKTVDLTRNKNTATLVRYVFDHRKQNNGSQDQEIALFCFHIPICSWVNVSDVSIHRVDEYLTTIVHWITCPIVKFRVLFDCQVRSLANGSIQWG